MPRIPDEWIERVKHEVLLEELARRAGVELRPVGHELVGRCPFPPHEDSTPSLSINTAKNVFQCFGCGVAGTSIDWIKQERGLDFRQAIEWLLWEFFPSAAQDLLGERKPERKQTRRNRAPELPCPFELDGDDEQLLNQYADYCHALFLEQAEPQDYVRKRGLDSSELVSHFKLGYQDRTLGLRLPMADTKAGREIRERFQKRGLIRESGHAHLTGSLVIPIRDEAGNVKNLYGRKTRDDLRKGTPDHLYSGPHRGVFNVQALKASTEIILCESLIDALTFWRWGLRNVTTSYGVNGFTEEIFEAMKASGTAKLYIAFDRDDAGDAGAHKVALKLMGWGIDCFRVLFPKGMDVNEVGLKMQPADKTLGLFLRSAEWMGNGRRPPGGGAALERGPAPHAPAPLVTEASAREAPPSAASTARADAPASSTSEAALPPSEATEEDNDGATEEENGSKPAPEAAPPSPTIRFAQDEAASSPAPAHVEPATLPAEASANETASASAPPGAPHEETGGGIERPSQDEVIFRFEDRRYRVRGLARCHGYGSLKLNVLVTREADFIDSSPMTGLHADTFDLYLSRQRQSFEKQASIELGVREDVIKKDLAVLLRKLEALQEELIRKALEPKVKAPTLTEKETKEAVEFWKSADLFSRIADDYTKCGLVGELVNKIATYVGATSRLLDRPLAIIIQSSSAAGKSTLMDKTLAFMPEEMREKYTAVSGKSLFYMDEGTILSHKILAIVEEEGAEKATYPLKILQSEGELVMASTGKDPHTGKLVTKIYRVQGPVMIILTTTDIEIDPELENRCLRLTVDESREQTKAIHELQRMKMTYEGHIHQAEKQGIEKLHQNAQRLLRRLRVHNPYARHLTFVSDQTRTRRDHDKYLALIETIALMHQFQRPVHRREIAGVSEEYVDVTLDDLELAGRLIGEILGKYLDGVPPQTRVFLDVLDEMVRKLCEEHGVARCDLRFSCRQIRELTGFTEFQVRVHLSRLISLEYVLQHKGPRGHSYVYELLYKGEGKDGRPFVLGLVDVRRLRREEAERWNLEKPEQAPAPASPAEPAVAPAAAARETAESWTTTFHSRGPEGRFEGHSSPLCAPDEPHSSPLQTASEPALEAALPTFTPESAENALIPPAAKIRSYTPVVPETTSGNGHRRAPRLNLLRFPPLGLVSSPRPAQETGNGSRPQAATGK